MVFHHLYISCPCFAPVSVPHTRYLVDFYFRSYSQLVPWIIDWNPSEFLPIEIKNNGTESVLSSQSKSNSEARQRFPSSQSQPKSETQTEAWSQFCSKHIENVGARNLQLHYPTLSLDNPSFSMTQVIVTNYIGTFPKQNVSLFIKASSRKPLENLAMMFLKWILSSLQVFSERDFNLAEIMSRIWLLNFKEHLILHPKYKLFQIYAIQICHYIFRCAYCSIDRDFETKVSQRLMHFLKLTWFWSRHGSQTSKVLSS